MSRYHAVHQNPAGSGDSRPTAQQIIRDEKLIGQMKDKVFLITGCSSGIGIETARAIASTGARVFLATRSLEKGQAACKDFLEPGRIELLQLDTSSLTSVRAAAATFLSRSSTLNVLICNAGVMHVPTREESVDGFEIQLATNYLGHFLLFWLLRDAMLRATSTGFQSRLVNVSSSGHHASEIQFGDLNLVNEGAYQPGVAYGQSKLAQIYMANSVERLYGTQGLHALSVMPGGIFTNLQKYIPSETRAGWRSNPVVMTFIKNLEQGAATTVFAAVSRDWEGRGGRYLEDCAEASSSITPGMSGVKSYAYDDGKEARLWELTLQILGINEESDRVG
ncbi:NAD(P)-binding protein [Aspergillus sclerotiicarbonarius CBS 121057]|uniref:NAD(P)-binding protein n=1 Tax=Aspergillus sclerotiicarbonarius (strain CBS 121057 / IBT 28362) TaxID=1448318 RepID=A0A319ESD7_ASPSB|nr:NAD(P)-binding protein [Aspergillus sclerotiicarbonarius CBS 121057]